MQCISNYLEEEFKDPLLTAPEFSLMMDETTDMTSLAVLNYEYFFVM